MITPTYKIAHTPAMEKEIEVFPSKRKLKTSKVRKLKSSIQNSNFSGRKLVNNFFDKMVLLASKKELPKTITLPRRIFSDKVFLNCGRKVIIIPKNAIIIPNKVRGVRLSPFRKK